MIPTWVSRGKKTSNAWFLMVSFYIAITVGFMMDISIQFNSIIQNGGEN